VLTSGFTDSFVRCCWVDLYVLSRLRAYLEQKTLSLRRAFNVGAAR
jgi:hypothetical protein